MKCVTNQPTNQPTTKPSRPILRWHGGKWMLAPWIISHFPKHRIYTEVYGGAGSVLMRKDRVFAEIYNDLDGEVVNLFRVLRDREKAEELKRSLEYTPFARAEFELSYQLTEEPLERARRTIVRCAMGFGTDALKITEKTGFRARSMKSGRAPSMDWMNYPKKLQAVIERLQGVVVENRPALDLLKIHDGPETLHYLDPPYVTSTRTDKGHRKGSYVHEMTDRDHAGLAAAVKKLKGFVVLSGYDCPLYERLYRGFKKTTRKALADGARARVETLWFNKRAWENQPHPQLNFGGSLA